MDTQNLTAFLYVADCGSFSVAAEKLYLTQPAVSKRIAALEEQLSCKLFDRIGRSVSLTEAGNLLLPRARSITRNIEDTRRALADLSGEVAGRLSLATSHHISLHHLPSVLREYTQRYPQVELDLSFMDSEKAYHDVSQGQIELAMITLSPAPQSHVVSHAVWDDPLQFVVSPEHPLAPSQRATSSPLQLSDLANYPAILPAPNTYTTQIVAALFDKKRLALQLKMATNYLETIKMMVSINLGWSVLPITLMDNELCELEVTAVKLSRQLGVIHHRDRQLSNAAQAFIRSLNLKSTE